MGLATATGSKPVPVYLPWPRTWLDADAPIHSADLPDADVSLALEGLSAEACCATTASGAAAATRASRPRRDTGTSYAEASARQQMRSLKSMVFWIATSTSCAEASSQLQI